MGVTLPRSLTKDGVRSALVLPDHRSCIHRLHASSCNNWHDLHDRFGGRLRRWFLPWLGETEFGDDGEASGRSLCRRSTDIHGFLGRQRRFDQQACPRRSAGHDTREARDGATDQ
jgi:hypothetical protein